METIGHQMWKIQCCVWHRNTFDVPLFADQGPLIAIAEVLQSNKQMRSLIYCHKHRWELLLLLTTNYFQMWIQALHPFQKEKRMQQLLSSMSHYKELF